MFMLRSGQCPFPLLSPPHLSPPRQRLPKISSIFLPLQHPQPSHHMQLPIEIFEAVIDQARDNSASLRNLALTCATFLPRSRYHLFSSIIIQGMNRMGSCGDFFDSHPWLLPLIYKVTVSTKIRQDYPSRNIRVLDRVPVNLLTRLPNVRAWSMELVTAGWQASLSLHRSMLAMYRTYSSRIQSLNLSGIRFRSFLDFTGLVAAFTSIRSLICSNLKIESWPEEEFNLSFYMGRGGRLSRRPQLSTFTVSLQSPVGVNCVRR